MPARLPRVSRLRAAATAALFACAASVVSAQSLTDLPAELERVRGALGSASVEQIADIVATIPPTWHVRSDGERIEVPTAWLTSALDEARKDPAQWARRRDALIARIDSVAGESTRASQSPVSLPDMDRSRAVAAGILARDEFQRNASENVLVQLRRRISEWLVSLWDRFGGNRIGTERMARLLAWITGLAALGALSWWLIASLLRSADRSGLALTPPAARRRSARAWAQQAVGAADPREVVRCAYRAAVATLEEDGTWRHDAARTPREHVRLLPQDHRRRQLFADVARRFEDVWFGARTPTVDDTRTLLGRLEELGCLRAE